MNLYETLLFIGALVYGAYRVYLWIAGRKSNLLNFLRFCWLTIVLKEKVGICQNKRCRRPSVLWYGFDVVYHQWNQVYTFGQCAYCGAVNSLKITHSLTGKTKPPGRQIIPGTPFTNLHKMPRLPSKRQG